MKLAYQVLVGGVQFDDWTRVEVERRGVTVNVTIAAADPWWTVTHGTTVVVRIGRTIAGDDDLIELVSGPVVAKNRVQRWNADALQITVDASDTRLSLSAEDEIVYRHKPFEDILHDVYVKRLGFPDVSVHLPAGKVEEFTIPVTASLHGAVQGLIGALSPKSWREPISGAWVVMDTKRPIPAAWPARELPLRTVVDIADQGPPPTHINQALIAYPGYSEIGDETGQHPYVEVTRPIDDDVAPAGFAKSGSSERVRLYMEDPSDPTKVTRTVKIADTVEEFTNTGELATRTETNYTYVAGTFDQLRERTEIEKFVRIVTPGSGAEVIRSRYEDQRTVWIPTGIGREREKIATYGKITGEVLEPDLVPLDDASRDGLTGEDPTQTTRWAPIEHSHERICQLGGEVCTILTTWDDLTDGVHTQRSYDAIGSNKVTPEQGRAEYLHTDDDSIADPAIGRRPVVSFDGMPYGLDLSKEIVDAHIFGGFAAVQRTASATLAKSDPTWHEGIIVRSTDRQGGEGLWVVDYVVDTIVPAENLATTKLGLVELRVV